MQALAAGAELFFLLDGVGKAGCPLLVYPQTCHHCTLIFFENAVTYKIVVIRIVLTRFECRSVVMGCSEDSILFPSATESRFVPG